MAAKRKQRQKSTVINQKADTPTKDVAITAAPPMVKDAALAEDHLPPLALVFTILICSGALWVLGLRDLMATGKNFLGPMDDAFMVRIYLCNYLYFESSAAMLFDTRHDVPLR